MDFPLPGCHGFKASRRQWLAANGAAGISALLGKEVLATARPEATRSLIVVYLTGGLAHQDSFDPKPKAPLEIRGEFSSIQTKLPGIRFSEHLPMLAARADQFSLVRSLVGFVDEHSSYQNLTGFPMGIAQREGKPHLGSMVARALGPAQPTTPPFVDLFPVMQHRPYNSPGPGQLGQAAMGAKLDTRDLGSMKVLPDSMEALKVRKALIQNVNAQSSGFGNDFDGPYSRAFDLLVSQSLSRTLNIEAESERTRDRYGRGDSKHQGDGAPFGTTNCCLPEGWWNQGRELSLSLMGFGILTATTSNTCVGIFPC